MRLIGRTSSALLILSWARGQRSLCLFSVLTATLKYLVDIIERGSKCIPRPKRESGSRVCCSLVLDLP